MTVGYYVYYRVAPGEFERGKQLVGALQDEVRASTGVSGRLLRRRDDETTWMEIYEGVSDLQAFEASLVDAVERSGFASLLASGSTRITEIFGPF